MKPYQISEALSLIPLTVKDANALFEIIDKNKNYLRPWMEWVKYHTEPQDTFDWIKTLKMDDLYTGDQVWGIRFENRLVGTIGCHRGAAAIRHIEIGYWLDLDVTGRGIMTRSVAAVIDHAIKVWDANRVMIRTDVKNIKSQGIPNRLGFQKDGILRDDAQTDGKFSDSYIYMLLAREWNGYSE